MFCSKCGHDCGEGLNFCEQCGNRLDGKSQIILTSSATLEKVFNWVRTRKTMLIWTTVIVVACLLLANAMGWFNTAEENLTDDIWYSKAEYGEYGERIGRQLRFRSNGKVECVAYRYVQREGNEGYWYTCDRDEWEWEILDDKTLYIDKRSDEYYEWSDDWRVTPSYLVIDGVTYYHEDIEGYTEDD